MNTVSKRRARSKRQTDLVAMTEEDLAFETRMAAIQMLIPVALERVNDDLQKEHAALVGKRYGRGTPLGPWGTNAGSVFLGDQKVKITVPRVRDRVAEAEVPLRVYQRLQSPGIIDWAALQRVINGISTAKYTERIQPVLRKGTEPTCAW